MFNQKETTEKLQAYIAKYYTKSDLPIKDFMNMYTGEITCGRCNKKMKGLKAIFHWHFNMTD